MLSKDVISTMLKNCRHQLQQLEELYNCLPSTTCRRQTHCCSMLPEMTFVEALGAIQRLVDMPPIIRQPVIQQIIRYFFINPAKITACPFLNNQNCRIYEDRFFCCRAYGLWSPEYYGKISALSREAKNNLQQQWKALGITLPKTVINFQVPYCLFVKTKDNIEIDDKMLLKISDEIERLSQHYSQWHQLFRQEYFSDLSFLLAALLFGLKRALQIKFSVVRDWIMTGDGTKLNIIVEELAELFVERISPDI